MADSRVFSMAYSQEGVRLVARLEQGPPVGGPPTRVKASAGGDHALNFFDGLDFSFERIAKM